MESNSEIITHSDAYKHPELYISDGNIILSAMPNDPDTPVFWQLTTEVNDPEKAIFFRVHKSTLAKHSKIFSDMFGLPVCPDGDLNSMYDGVPVVDMPDKAEDLAVLLNHFYGPP